MPTSHGSDKIGQTGFSAGRLICTLKAVATRLMRYPAKPTASMTVLYGARRAVLSSGCIVAST